MTVQKRLNNRPHWWFLIWPSHVYDTSNHIHYTEPHHQDAQFYLSTRNWTSSVVFSPPDPFPAFSTAKWRGVSPNWFVMFTCKKCIDFIFPKIYGVNVRILFWENFSKLESSPLLHCSPRAPLYACPRSCNHSMKRRKVQRFLFTNDCDLEAKWSGPSCSLLSSLM